jgi:hypothetical protein
MLLLRKTSTAFGRDKLREIAAMDSWWDSSDLVKALTVSMLILTPSTSSPVESSSSETALLINIHIASLARALAMLVKDATLFGCFRRLC